MPVLASKPYPQQQFTEIGYDRPYAPTILPRGMTARPSHMEVGLNVFDNGDNRLLMANTVPSNGQNNMQTTGPAPPRSSPTVVLPTQGRPSTRTLDGTFVSLPHLTATARRIRGNIITNKIYDHAIADNIPGASDRPHTDNTTPTPDQGAQSSPSPPLPPPPPPAAANTDRRPQWSQHSPPWGLERRTQAELSGNFTARMGDINDVMRRVDNVLNVTDNNGSS